MLDFLKEALHAPLRVGAVAPSSPRLAEMMARRAVADRPRQILEVGAGDGAITKALLAARSPETHLLICERSETFRPALEQLLAHEINVTLFIGDVQALSDSWSGQIDVIVSGLPFASFPATLRHDLLAQFQTLLRQAVTSSPFNTPGSSSRCSGIISKNTVIRTHFTIYPLLTFLKGYNRRK